MKLLIKFSTVLAIALMLAAPAMADVWDETTNGGGDAGDFPTGSFQVSNTVGPVYDEITGTLAAVDVDAYGITINSATWSADVVSGTETDTRIWLFDLSGNFMMGNDDSSPTGGALQSFISDSASFTGGGGSVDSPTDPTVGESYVLVINGFADDALDSGGAPLTTMNANFDALVGVDPNSTGSFGSWEGVDQGGGTYDIVLSGATLTVVAIPEPTALGILAFGLIGCTIKRRRK